MVGFWDLRVRALGFDLCGSRLGVLGSGFKVQGYRLKVLNAKP